MTTAKPGETATQTRTRARVSSGDRGAPISGLFARAEKKYPGIEQRVGLSSAALRAGEMVRGMRKAKGWTQTELAEKLGWDQVRISNIERGEGILGPTFDVMTKIADACGYDFQVAMREPAMAAPAKPAPLHNAIIAEIKGYVGEVFEKIGDVIAPKHEPQSQPQFVYTCNAFVSSFDANAPVHAALIDGIITPGVKTTIKKEQVLPGIPFIEVTGRGQRMVMVPYAVEPAPQGQIATTGIEVKFFANRVLGDS